MWREDKSEVYSTFTYLQIHYYLEEKANLETASNK